MLNIVLHEPEIPPNTGNIGRLCAATNTRLHLIEPLGFSLDEKQLKRAGMDYWKYVNCRVWKNWNHFFENESPKSFYLLTTKSKTSYLKTSFQENDYLIFGRETKGLPDSLLKQYEKNCLTIPMPGEHSRSLNLATSVGIVLYEALRQTGKV